MSGADAVDGDPSGHDGWERYAPWEGTYRVSPWSQFRGGSARGGRPRKVGMVLLAAVVVVVAVSFAVHLIIALVRWDLLGLLEVLITPVNAFLLLGLAWWRWPPQTNVTARALFVRSEPWRTRTVSWDEVVEVQPPGRFDEYPVALLAGRERLPLVGLPLAVAEQMAAVTRPAPSSRMDVSGPRLADPQEDLDGPFRRGRQN